MHDIEIQLYSSWGFLLPTSVQEYQICYNLTKKINKLKIQKFQTNDSHSYAYHDCSVSKQGSALKLPSYNFFVISKYSTSKQGGVLHILKNEVWPGLRSWT